MANGEGLAIDGNGSVRWQAVNIEDDIRKGEMVPYGDEGRRTVGVDKRHGEFFRIELVVPDVWTSQFLGQFPGAAGKAPGERVVIYLPIRKADKQIEVHWTPGIVPPQGA